MFAACWTYWTLAAALLIYGSLTGGVIADQKHFIMWLKSKATGSCEQQVWFVSYLKLLIFNLETFPLLQDVCQTSRHVPLNFTEKKLQPTYNRTKHWALIVYPTSNATVKNCSSGCITSPWMVYSIWWTLTGATAQDFHLDIVLWKLSIYDSVQL